MIRATRMFLRNLGAAVGLRFPIRAEEADPCAPRTTEMLILFRAFEVSKGNIPEDFDVTPATLLERTRLEDYESEERCSWDSFIAYIAERGGETSSVRDTGEIGGPRVRVTMKIEDPNRVHVAFESVSKMGMFSPFAFMCRRRGSGQRSRE